MSSTKVIQSFRESERPSPSAPARCGPGFLVVSTFIGHPLAQECRRLAVTLRRAKGASRGPARAKNPHPPSWTDAAPSHAACRSPPALSVPRHEVAHRIARISFVVSAASWATPRDGSRRFGPGNCLTSGHTSQERAVLCCEPRNAASPGASARCDKASESPLVLGILVLFSLYRKALNAQGAETFRLSHHDTWPTSPRGSLWPFRKLAQELLKVQKAFGICFPGRRQRADMFYTATTRRGKCSGRHRGRRVEAGCDRSHSCRSIRAEISCSVAQALRHQRGCR